MTGIKQNQNGKRAFHLVRHFAILPVNRHISRAAIPRRNMFVAPFTEDKGTRPFGHEESVSFLNITAPVHTEEILRIIGLIDRVTG